jgi:hypothetical protein
MHTPKREGRDKYTFAGLPVKVYLREKKNVAPASQILSLYRV